MCLVILVAQDAIARLLLNGSYQSLVISISLNVNRILFIDFLLNITFLYKFSIDIH